MRSSLTGLLNDPLERQKQEATLIIKILHVEKFEGFRFNLWGQLCSRFWVGEAIEA